MNTAEQVAVVILFLVHAAIIIWAIWRHWRDILDKDGNIVLREPT
jgi:cbb3-type cytochrome oxidase subunit 3